MSNKLNGKEKAELYEAANYRLQKEALAVLARRMGNIEARTAHIEEVVEDLSTGQHAQMERLKALKETTDDIKSTMNAVAAQLFLNPR